MEPSAEPKSILFVTAFKDINRGSWNNHFQRSTEEYISYFKRLTKQPINLICFCETPVANRLAEFGFIKCYPYDEQATFFRFLEKERSIMESESYKALVNGRINGEYNIPEYNLVNHNKIIFIKRAQKLFPSYTHYGWIDFGYMRTNKIYYGFEWPLDDLIHFSSFPIPMTIPDPVENITKNIDFIQGSIYIMPRILIDWFFKEYVTMYESFHRLGIVDDDQPITYQIYKKDPSKFKLHIFYQWHQMLEDCSNPKGLYYSDTT